VREFEPSLTCPEMVPYSENSIFYKQQVAYEYHKNIRREYTDRRWKMSKMTQG
jgi:hypothetical protein